MSKPTPVETRIKMIFSDPTQRKRAEAALADLGLTLGLAMPDEPTRAMVRASMSAVTRRIDVVDKEEKHRLRLVAALTAYRLENKAGREALAADKS